MTNTNNGNFVYLYTTPVDTDHYDIMANIITLLHIKILKIVRR